MPELIVSQNDRKVFRYPLDGQRIMIGRSSANDLVLTGDSVSRHHVIIERRDGSYWLTDESSTGTMVNGTRFDGHIRLSDNANIDIAEWRLTFREQSPDSDEDRRRQADFATHITQNQPSQRTNMLKFEPQGRIRMIRPTLIIEDAGTGKRHFLVKQPRVVAGSAADCEVRLSDEFVSKYHLELKLSDFGFHVTDLDSTNGTFMRGARIRESYLRDGDEIALGKSRILVAFETETPAVLEPFGDGQFCGIYGESREMRLLFAKIKLAAPTDMTVLIQGESGTGKEMVAQALHQLSARRDKPYVVLNCGAISPNLVESELFGHEKGAFTGADQRRLGAFETANGGTLFLDEIGELPLEAQAKVLRALEYQTFRRVGGNQEIKVDVRLVAATHRDLARMVPEGRFREDLFYRLCVLPLKVPTLRERKEDIPLLADVFVKRFAAGSAVYMDFLATEKLQSHSWPGNVRELKNTIMRALAFGDGKTLRPADIEFISVATAKNSAEPDEGCDLLDPASKDEFERDRIVAALSAARGDKDEAARMLGMGRSTLFRKIRELGIEE